MIAEFLRGFRHGMGQFGQTLSTIVNSALLLFVYLIGVGASALTAKLFRKHFLELRIAKSQESYWDELRMGKRPLTHYYRQF